MILFFFRELDILFKIIGNISNTLRNKNLYIKI